MKNERHTQSEASVSMNTTRPAEEPQFDQEKDADSYKMAEQAWNVS